MMLRAVIFSAMVALISGYTRIVDLTHNMNSRSPIWPTRNLTFTVTVDLNKTIDGGFTKSNKLLFTEHTGTQIDAPMHFYMLDAPEPQWYIHQIPAERCVGRLHVLNLAAKAAADPDYEVTQEDIIDYEATYGKITKGGIVLLDFDWAKKIDNEDLYYGTATPKDTTTLHFPGFGLEAAKLLYQRGVSGVGTQCPSDDPGQSSRFEVHRYLLARNVYLLENVGDMSDLPSGGGKDTIVTVGFMKTEMGTGAPARILALVDDDGTNTGSRSISMAYVVLITAIALNMIASL